MVNPYIAGAPVTEARMFFGREDVFAWIEQNLTGLYTDHILVIHGQRRVGKTSVLKQLPRRLPERYIPVFFDLQGRTYTTVDRLLWWLAREIARTLRQDRGVAVPLPEYQRFVDDAECFEGHFLSSVLSCLGEHTLLLTFDEFDNLEEAEVRQTLARPLIDHLRRLMGRPGLGFIFSIGSSGRKLENMRASYTQFFKAALYKKIIFLSRDETYSLITRPVEGVLEYEPGAPERIYEITFGHPYFTQLVCHELFSYCEKTDRRRVGQPEVEAVLDDVVERGTVNLKFMWDDASDLEKWVLAALTHSQSPRSTPALAEFLRQERIRFSQEELNSALLRLREKDVLTEDNRFVIRLLSLWLQKNRPLERVREELTEVNPIANRYIEIGLEYRDSGLHPRAAESFREALRVDPANVRAQVNLASVYLEQKDFDRAAAEFEKALLIDEEDVAARVGLCQAHVALGDRALSRGRAREAIQSYERVLSINAEHTEARQRVAEIHRQRGEKALSEGRYDEATGAFMEALKFTPEDESLTVRAAQAQEQKQRAILAGLLARADREQAAGNWEGALTTLQEALRVAPEDPAIQDRMVRLKEAQRVARLEAARTRARRLVREEKWNQAVAAFQAVMALGPEGPAAVQAEIQAVERKRSLAHAYAQARAAMSGKDYAQAVAWLKYLIAQDETYKDSPRLLALAVERQQAQRRPRLAAWALGAVRTLRSAMLGIWFVLAVSGLTLVLLALAGGIAPVIPLTPVPAVAPVSPREAGSGIASATRTFLVTSTADSGPGTLRQALSDATCGDTIGFDPRVFLPSVPATITLFSALPPLLQGDLTIDANNTGVILDGSNLGTTPQTVLLDDVSLTVDGGPNLIENGDFSAGRGHWRAWDEGGDAARALDDHDYHSPPFSYAWSVVAQSGQTQTLYDTASRSTPFDPWGRYSPYYTDGTVWIPVTGGGTAVVRYWYRHGILGMTLYALLSDGRQVEIGRADGEPRDDWTQAAITGTVPANALGLAVEFGPVAYPETYDGLNIASDGNVVQGLQIINFPHCAIALEGSQNIIGGDPSIGAGPLGQGNLLSGVGSFGVGMWGTRPAYNTIVGNRIGTDLSGTRAWGIRRDGLHMSDAHHNLVVRNLIGGVQGYGVYLFGPLARYNVIAGNLVGTDTNGLTPLPNQDGGIAIAQRAHDNTVGPGNLIAYNAGAGIGIYDQAVRNAITRNSIHDNDGPGIDIPEGGNEELTAPLIDQLDPGNGRVSGRTCADCRVEIFSGSDDEGWVCEGWTTADDQGVFTFNKGTALAGRRVTATATDPSGNTSPFSEPSP